MFFHIFFGIHKIHWYDLRRIKRKTIWRVYMWIIIVNDYSGCIFNIVFERFISREVIEPDEVQWFSSLLGLELCHLIISSYMTSRSKRSFFLYCDFFLSKLSRSLILDCSIWVHFLLICLLVLAGKWCFSIL